MKVLNNSEKLTEAMKKIMQLLKILIDWFTLSFSNARRMANWLTRWDSLVQPNSLSKLSYSVHELVKPKIVQTSKQKRERERGREIH